MADNKDPLGILSEGQKKKDPLGILSEEPVKKKDLSLPSTDFSASSQFLQEKPTTTIPFKTGVEVEKPKVKVNRENVIKRADAGELAPDLKELSDLNQRLIKGGVLTAGEIERGELDKGDIDDFTLRTRVVRDLREKSIEKAKALENGAKKLQQQGQALIQQYEQAPSPELKSQIEQLDKDYQLTVKEYNRARFAQDYYEKRLVQTSDSIKRLANEQLPDDFFSGVYKGLKGNVNSYTEAVNLLKKSKKEQIEYAKTKGLQAPTKEAPTSAQIGEMVGGVIPDVGVNIGFSLMGLPGAGAAVVSARQGAQGYADEFSRAFNQAKEQGIETGELDRNGKPIIRIPTDDEAYDIATKAAGVGFGTGVLEGLAGSVTGGVGGKLADRATTTVGRVLTERAVDVGLDAGIAGTMQTGRNLFDRAQGLQTSVGEGVLENMAGEVLLSAPVNVVAGRKEIAKAKKASEAAKAQIFESVVNAKDNPEELKKLTENLEIIKNQGLVTESEYNDIVKKAQQYQEALPTIPEEIKNKKAAADLIIERNDLAEKAQTVDEAYKKPIEERIKQINEELLKVDEKPITPPPSAEVTLPEVEVTAEKPAPTEAIEAQKVEVKEEPKEVVAKEVVTEEKPIEEVVDKTSEQISKEQTIETEILLAGEAAKRRNEGRFVKDGIEFVRNEKIEGSKGESGLVRFTSEPGGKGVVMPFKYKLVEAETLQPSHQNGLRNPNNFIPEAQPKNRNDKASLSAEDGFAQKPRFNELGKSEYPYNGAPVVNERNEVIQGNNRAAGLKRGYSQKTHNYKQDLLNNAEQFGFTKEQVEGMKNPVLVREVSVSDDGAIELGNYDVKDLETGGKRRIDPIATTRRLPFDIKGRLSEIIFKGEETLNQSIRNNKKAIIELLSPFLNQSQKNTILDNGELTESGIQDLESVFKHFLFDGGDVALPELFESLSYNQREGLRKSLPYIFSTGFEKSIIPEVQEAIIILNHYNASGIGEFKKWLSQSDMFNDSRTPKDIYTPTALEIARILNDAKSQKEIIGLPDPKRGLEASNFAKYSSLVKSTPSTIFEEATSGMSKKEAIKQTFNTEYDEKTESTITKGGDREIGTEPTKKAEPTAETKTTDVTPVEQTTFDMIVDEKGNKKYKNREEAMADYEKNKLSEYGETFEEFLQRILCP